MPRYKAIAVNEKTGAFVPQPNAAKDGYAVYNTEQEAKDAADIFADNMNESSDITDWKAFFEMILEEEPVTETSTENLPESMQQALDNGINPG